MLPLYHARLFILHWPARFIMNPSKTLLSKATVYGRSQPYLEQAAPEQSWTLGGARFLPLKGPASTPNFHAFHRTFNVSILLSSSIHPSTSLFSPLLPPFQITMRPKHRAELNALMALATPPAVSTGGDKLSIGGDNFYLPLMSLSSSRPEWPQNGVDYDSDDGDTRPRALSLAGVPEIIQRRICFFLNVPSARNLAITCSGLRDCAEERIWETVDIHRLMK